MRSSPLYSSSRHRAAVQGPTAAEANPPEPAPRPPGRLRTFAARHERPLLVALRQRARAGRDADLQRHAAFAARAHPGRHRRRGAAHARDANAAFAGGEGVREAARIGRSRARSRGHRGQQRGRNRRRHRRRDPRQGRHPHQPARRARREEDRRRVRRRPRIRGDRHRHAAGARPGGAAGEDDPRRPPGGDDALDARSHAGRPGGRRRAFRSASALRCPTASCRDCGASTGRPKASDC